MISRYITVFYTGMRHDCQQINPLSDNSVHCLSEAGADNGLMSERVAVAERLKLVLYPRQDVIPKGRFLGRSSFSLRNLFGYAL